MEQLRVILALIKKHHFWLLLILLFGVSIGGWYMASTGVASDTASNKQKIDSEFNQQNTLRGKPFKPNDGINELQAVQVQEQAAKVLEIWQTLYGRQKEEALIWPDDLRADFARYMQNKSFGDTIRDDYRERYLNYIQKQFKKLLEIVDARDLSDGRQPMGGRGMAGGFDGPGLQGGVEAQLEPEETHMVDWVDQAVLSSQLNMTRVPSSIEIWVIQEDLWVYETLLEAIAKTNQDSGATRRSRAPIRTIQELTVGRGAAAGSTDALSARIFVPENAGLAAAGMGMGMGEGGMDGGMGGFDGGMGMGMGRGMDGGMGGFDGGMGMMGGMGGEMGMGRGAPGATGGDTATALLSGRYLNEQRQPIMEVSTDYKFGNEYKQLPIRMVLEMDRRSVPELIVNLANAPMKVEVDQLRVNPGGQKRRPGAQVGGNQAESFDRRPHLGLVVLQGAVYIFNKPAAEAFSVASTDGGF